MPSSKNTPKGKQRNISTSQKTNNSGKANGMLKMKPSVVQNMPQITPDQMKNILDGCYAKALDGIPNVSKDCGRL